MVGSALSEMLRTLICLETEFGSSVFSSHSEVCFWRGRVTKWRVKSNKSSSPSSCPFTQNFRWSQDGCSALFWWSDCLWLRPFFQISCNYPPEVKGKTMLAEGSYLPIRQCLKLIISLSFLKEKKYTTKKAASLLQQLT